MASSNAETCFSVSLMSVMGRRAASETAGGIRPLRRGEDRVQDVRRKAEQGEDLRDTGRGKVFPPSDCRLTPYLTGIKLSAPVHGDAERLYRFAAALQAWAIRAAGEPLSSAETSPRCSPSARPGRPAPGIRHYRSRTLPTAPR